MPLLTPQRSIYRSTPMLFGVSAGVLFLLVLLAASIPEATALWRIVDVVVGVVGLVYIVMTLNGRITVTAEGVHMRWLRRRMFQVAEIASVGAAEGSGFDGMSSVPVLRLHDGQTIKLRPLARLGSGAWITAYRISDELGVPYDLK